MAFNPAPSGYFPNINVGEVVTGVTGVFIPWSDLEEFNATTSGDVRQLYYAFNDAMYSGYSGLATADKPDSMTLRLSGSTPSAVILRKTFTNIFELDLDQDFTLVPEPTG